MPTKSPSGLRTSKPSRLTSDTLTITLQEPCFQGILLSHYLSFLWLQRAGFSMGCSCGKTIFQALKNCFFRTALMTRREAQLCKKKALKNVFFRAALMKLRQARLSKKKSGSKKSFFRMPLVKSANSTSLPRLSSLQIVQMHAIHN